LLSLRVLQMQSIKVVMDTFGYIVSTAPILFVVLVPADQLVMPLGKDSAMTVAIIN